jgi:outer membrane protein assembly factor BamA
VEERPFKGRVRVLKMTRALAPGRYDRICGVNPHKFLFLIISVSLVSLVPAQTTRKPPSTFKLTSITATGTKRYTPPEIIAATGLQLGQTVSEADFKRVSQLLGETGAFSNVAYTYQYSTQGTKLDFQIEDSNQFIPVRFDNFVWFSDQELVEKLHNSIPLFHGQLPLAGSLIDQVSDALQSLLLERKLQGRADYMRTAHQDGPIEAFVFKVTGPTIHIRNVEFSGAAPTELPLLQAAAKNLQGQEYLRSILQVQADKNLLPIYLERGYLKAAFADSQAKIAQENPEETIVDVNFPVDPGRQYKLTKIQWSDNAVFPVEKLQPLIHLQTGQYANALQLASDLEAVQKLYGTRGYLAARVRSVPQMDDAQSTVSYELQVHEGDVYHMGELEIQGLDARTTARLVEGWKIRGGDVYDASYPQQFLNDTNHLIPLAPWKISIHNSLNEKDKTVDVTLRFDPKAQ